MTELKRLVFMMHAIKFAQNCNVPTPGDLSLALSMIGINLRTNINF